MVRTATHWPSERPHPDPIRILAISASIALNVAALALLLRPPEFVQQAAQTDPPPITIITQQVKPPEPPPVPVIRQHVQQLPVQPQPVQRQQTITQVIFPDATPVSIPVDPNPVIGTVTPPQPPQPIEASLTPIVSPAPTYPPIALRDGITGTVELELLVGVDGRVVEVHVTHSSGNRQLDNAAREQVLRSWRFQPAMRDGVAVQALGRVPIMFTLDGR
jgi:protein TonB